MDPADFLKKVANFRGIYEIFIAGGPVRDWLLRRSVKDVDLVLNKDAIFLARKMATVSSGTFVMLDEEFQVARVVVEGYTFDFSQYRRGASSIEEDLCHRDFTINAMAVRLTDILTDLKQTGQGLVFPKELLPPLLIDPFNGVRDIATGTVKAISRTNLQRDPLRLLRAFRFSAILGFCIDPQTVTWIEELAKEITRCAPERISAELDQIMASHHAGPTLKNLYSSGLLKVIVPETLIMDGVEQPGFHHLDVLGHLFETLSSIDLLVKDPCVKFANCKPLKEWIEKNKKKVPWVKWAAFMHDFGKPVKKGIKEDGRVTFYEHDRAGALMARDVAKRLRWSKSKQEFVSRLVRLHMRPFHLLNDLRKSGPTKRAMRRLLENIGQDYPALFLLAMADSMAGCGPMKPKGLDEEISLLFDKIHSFYLKSLKPIEGSPPLVRGNDVMEILGVGPGPVVGMALQAVKDAQVEGKISSKKEALALIRKLFEKNGS